MTGLLDSKLLHYAIPDADALCKFLEIFEHTSISGCILLQTALSHVRSKGGRKRYDRVKGLLGNLEKNFVVFSNEFYYETYSSREKDETYLRWQERCVKTCVGDRMSSISIGIDDPSLYITVGMHTFHCWDIYSETLCG